MASSEVSTCAKNIPKPPPLPRVTYQASRSKPSSSSSRLVPQETVETWDKLFKQGTGADTYVEVDNKSHFLAHSYILVSIKSHFISYKRSNTLREGCIASYVGCSFTCNATASKPIEGQKRKFTPQVPRSASRSCLHVHSASLLLQLRGGRHEEVRAPFVGSLTLLLGPISQKSLRRGSWSRMDQQGECHRRAPASSNLRRREDQLSMRFNGHQRL